MGSRNENKAEMIQKIRTAFMELYEKNSLENITIQALCRCAGMAKSTFYTYYEDKYSILDDIKNEILGSLRNISYDLKNVDITDVNRGRPLKEASGVVVYIREHLKEFKILLGPHGDPMFEIQWKNDIEKSFAPKFRKEKGNSPKADIACTIFSSALIGLYKYFIFKDASITDVEMSIMLGNILKYALFDFRVNC